MTFEEYQLGGRARYAAFVGAIQHILKAAVDVGGMKPHAITGRAKAADSLEKKLEDRGIDPASAIDERIKDLAGCRVVFLTNGQVDAFGHAGILHENFDVLDVNVHHAVPGTESETRLFDSTNYLVQLKPERLALAEYRPFAGMRAEIQVQTLLNHAWAEMGHDTIYKEPKFKHVGEQRRTAIKERMDRVMRDYLIPAGHDFDKIARDFHQLLAAEQGVEPAMQSLATSADNEVLGEAIGRLDDLILPHFDEPGAKFLKLLPVLLDVVERTRGSAAAAIETIYGNYPGKSGEDIALKVSRLVHDYRYADPVQTFDMLVRLYSGARADSERKIWLDLATQFSSHNLDVWKRYGPAIPQLVLEAIGKLGDKEIDAARGLVVAMLGNLLSPDIAGMTATSTTVTTHQATVAANEEVAGLRDQAIKRLEKLLDEAADDAVRGPVLESLRKAGAPPFNGSSDALVTMIMADAARVIAIEMVRAPSWGLELRRRCEVDALHCHHRFHVLPPFLKDNEGAIAAQQRLVAELLELRDLLNADGEFVRYKLLVGHDSVRPDAWESRAFDPEASRQWREGSFTGIVDGITDDTVDDWIARIRRYIAEPKSGGDHLWPMADCMRQFGEAKPKTAWRFLEAMDDALSPLLRALLLGIDAAGDWETIQRYVARWMGQGRFLGLLGEYLRWQEPFDIAMLEALIARSIELADERGILACLSTSSVRFEKAADRRLIDNVFMPAIGYLTEVRRHDWIHYVWGVLKGATVAALDEGEVQRLLDSFVAVPEIDFEADMLLALVAERFPGLVLDFFEARTQRERTGSGHRFDPIPFSLHNLQGPLSAHPGLLITAARRWYEQAPELHEFRGGRLLHHVFPTLAPEIAGPLAEMVKHGSRDDIGFVIATLRAYDGVEQIYALCMDIVDALGDGDALLGRVTNVLGQKGVLTGEFGYVEAEGEQHARLERWREDPRPKVQAYVREQRRRIEQSMAWEQRRAERDVEQRKRDWGEA
jgi:ppGpp synthetase/RelA/SpoT-type nucleotidyltranferase